MPKGFKNVSSILKNGNMAGNLTSTNVDISCQDNIGLQLVWTGTPVGIINVNVSLDQINWIPLTFTPSINQPAGSAGTLYLDLNQLSAMWLQVTYTSTSGSGTLDVQQASKAV
jgi:hypothetical protein